MFIFKGFKLSIVFVALFLTCSGIALAQQDFADLDSAAKHINDNYNVLIHNYVLTGVPMPNELVDQLEENTIKSRGILKYRKQFEEETKYRFNMIYAFIDHYRGDGEKAVSRAKSVYRAAEDNAEFRDCYLYLAYLNKDYDDIIKNANKLDLGSQAIASVENGNVLLANDTLNYQKNLFKTMQSQMGAAGMGAGFGDPNSAISPGINMGTSEPNIPGAPTPRTTNPVPMGGHDGFGGERSANPFDIPAQPAQPAGNRGNRGSRGNRGGGGGMGYGAGAGLGGMMPVDSGNALGGGSSQPSRTSRTTARPPVANPGFGMAYPANNTQQQETASALNLKPEYMPASMLGKQLSQMTLTDINGSVLSYSPNQGKLLCMLLWSHGDSMLADQKKELLNKFSESMGGFGVLQFVSVNCNEFANPLSMKILIDDIAKSPSPWVNCVMTPENKLQLADIEPASPVLLVADTTGTVCYVGPVDSTITKAMWVQEKINVGLNKQMGDAPQSSGFMNSIKSTVGKVMSGMSESKQNAIPDQPADTTANQNVRSVPVEMPKVSTKPKKVSIEDDPTILQARNKLQLAEKKMKIKFGISFGSALTLCDDVIEGWPGTEEAEQAKAYIREILSKGRGEVYRKDRIRQGKYVGE